MKKFKLLFKEKPVIGMIHLRALPGTPLYDGNLEQIVEYARNDLSALQSAGIDAILFCNENDRPYELIVDQASVATMSYVIGCLKKEIRVPFGVDVLWDPVATMALAAATGAQFVREVFVGLFASDMGLWGGRAAEALRYRKRLMCDNVLVFCNICAELSSALDTRSIQERAKSAVFSSLIDAVLISGPMAGVPPSLEILSTIKECLPDIPVLANTGVRHDTVAEILKVADGVIVGTALKKDGKTWNPVDQERAKQFMEIVRKTRQN
ncbi:MAG: BtpA/SgcQ family protein [Candidatus Hadarchaeum sp.]|uniref:BtpA/SgcQ family protein n=1 Tax=Candidatus Hadarchaeum sp. TaxID=2883567 RepID=UPI00317F78B5